MTSRAFRNVIRLNGTVFNVKEYGAVGDNVTSDTVAIQAAITAAEALGVPFTLWFPPEGTFLIDGPLRITANNVTLTGGGTLHTKSSSFTTPLLIPGLTSDARAGIIFWNGTTVNVPSVSGDTTY